MDEPMSREDLVTIVERRGQRIEALEEVLAEVHKEWTGPFLAPRGRNALITKISSLLANPKTEEETLSIEDRIRRWRKEEPQDETEFDIELLCEAEEELRTLRHIVKMGARFSCPDCGRGYQHTHCPECGSIDHVAEDCDMEG